MFWRRGNFLSLLLYNNWNCREYISYRKVGDHATNMPSMVFFATGTAIKDNIKYKYDKCGNITENPRKWQPKGKIHIRQPQQACHFFTSKLNFCLLARLAVALFGCDNVWIRGGSKSKLRAFIWVAPSKTTVHFWA